MNRKPQARRLALRPTMSVPAETPEPAREGQTFAGESLLVRYANLVRLPHTVFALPFALLGVVYASYVAPVTVAKLVLVIVAFTAAQIPGISGRVYPASLAGRLYPQGIPIRDEAELEQICREHAVAEVVFAYSDVPHAAVMHLASRALATGAGFSLLGPRRTMLDHGTAIPRCVPSGTKAVALVPVGGGGGLNAAKAAEVISLFEPNIVVPMHYSTPDVKVTLEALNKFLKEMGLGKQEAQASLKVTRSSLPDETHVIVLDYQRE